MGLLLVHHDRFISYGGSSKIKNFSSLEEARALRVYRYSCKKYHYFSLVTTIQIVWLNVTYKKVTKW